MGIGINNLIPVKVYRALVISCLAQFGLASDLDPSTMVSPRITAADSPGVTQPGASILPLSMKKNVLTRTSDPGAPLDLLQNQFNELLKTSRFGALVQIYHNAYIGLPVESSAELREILINHASRLVQRSDPLNAIALLRPYLDIYYRDVEALILIGTAYRDAGFMLDAIHSLRDAYQYEHRVSVSKLILSRENTVIGEYRQELSDSMGTQGLIDLYQHLTLSQPGVPGYFIALANAYIKVQRLHEAIATLRYVQHDLEVGDQAQLLIHRLESNIDSGRTEGS